jgi:hypothetical protein
VTQYEGYGTEDFGAFAKGALHNFYILRCRADRAEFQGFA